MNLSRFSLEGKNALVTGGSRGIGHAIALAFADAGANVAISGRKLPDLEPVAEELKQKGVRSLAVASHVAKVEESKALVDKVKGEWGRIDVLVNNAGIAIPRPFLEYTPDETWRIWRVNLFGTFFMEQRVAEHMVARAKEQDYKMGDPVVGKIINITSLSEEVGTCNVSAYAMTKAAIKLLTVVPAPIE